MKFLKTITLGCLLCLGVISFFPQTVCAQSSGIRVHFRLSDSTYRLNDLVADFDDTETLRELERRAYFGTRQEKLSRITELMQCGATREQAMNYVLIGLKEEVRRLQARYDVLPKDASVTFSPSEPTPFAFRREKSGKRLKIDALYAEIFEQLQRSEEITVTEQTERVLPAVTEQQLKAQTTLKAVFSTDYSASSAARKQNVRLALQKFHGKVVKSGQKVSFNDVVGERSAANGFQNAKIIVNGEYVDGIGGGVCQASTTLYNACLLAGLKINSCARHTLQSSYVEPSFDAMVSSATDFVFTNDTPSDLYFKIDSNDTTVAVSIYGVPNEYEIRRKSVVVKREKAQYDVREDQDGTYLDRVRYADESFVLKAGHDAVTSRGYLEYYKNGKKVKEKLLREDVYKGTKGILIRGGTLRRETKILSENLQESAEN